MIKLQVVKTEKNENLEAEMKQWEETFGHRNNRIMDFDRNGAPPQSEKTSTVLQVAISEEQWEAIRKAVLEKF